jgi:hypothetical protein
VLPGKTIAEVRVDSTFGADETSEGSAVSLVSGSLGGQRAENLVVIAKDSQ